MISLCSTFWALLLLVEVASGLKQDPSNVSNPSVRRAQNPSGLMERLAPFASFKTAANGSVAGGIQKVIYAVFKKRWFKMFCIFF